MPRILSDQLNELKIRDNISGSDIVFYYRMPTTAERLAYANESFKREDGEIKAAVGETRIKYGLEILEGIRDGDFELDGGRPLSSDEKDDFFDKDWKQHLAEHAADLIELLAVRVFEAPAMIISKKGAEKN